MGQICPQEMAQTYAHAFPHSRPWAADEFAGFMADPLVHIFGTNNSFLVARIIAGEAEILTLATCPQHRRKGLAIQALDAFFRFAQENDVAAVFLEVAADNAAALALYTKCDFQKSGLRAGYYKRENGPAQDAVILRKDMIFA